MRSDFAVFYRIDEIELMPGPRLCSYALRVFAYAGVMQSRLNAEHQKQSKTHDGQVREYVSNDEAIAVAGDGYFETVSA